MATRNANGAKNTAIHPIHPAEGGAPANQGSGPALPGKPSVQHPLLVDRIKKARRCVQVRKGKRTGDRRDRETSKLPPVVSE
jgi:hypothetical protein